MKIRRKNVLESYLTLLEVKHTESFTDQYFNEHPYKFSLYGISKMLFDYDVDNGATQIPDKEQNLSEIGTPFIAQFVSACCYLVSILGINLIASKVNNKKETQSLWQSMNSLKADEDVFKALLKKQPYYDTSDCDSLIHFGNRNSKLRIIVLSNPYCNPCTKMHKRIEELLKKANISVQYIVSSINEKLNSTNKYLIATCLKNKTGFVMQVLKDWFEKGKPIGDAYFKDMELDMENPEIEVELGPVYHCRCQTGQHRLYILYVLAYNKLIWKITLTNQRLMR